LRFVNKLFFQIQRFKFRPVTSNETVLRVRAGVVARRALWSSSEFRRRSGLRLIVVARVRINTCSRSAQPSSRCCCSRRRRRRRQGRLPPPSTRPTCRHRRGHCRTSASLPSCKGPRTTATAVRARRAAARASTASSARGASTHSAGRARPRRVSRPACGTRRATLPTTGSARDGSTAPPPTATARTPSAARTPSMHASRG
jgi:hypothetical protein